ncbi:bifunctional 3-(3-hydroxy-phenyl)propionate/3-hydroxycinnamic acid hydroxylase [Mycolicibacterium sp. CH28]|nr:bifunctional 3-(3-hydroxy-phenyl)propionate/3-hydroxycinnamic acid hydroxylase [Mycolicibacterium sp. CH28]
MKCASSATRTVSVDVAIVGAGPCGALMANMLGHYGIETALIDRSTEVVEYPRAVGIDDESLRAIQLVGLADDVMADAIANVPLRLFDRNGRCLADIRPSTREFGWSRRNIFMQQNLEHTLRQGLARFTGIQLLLGHDVVALTPTDAGADLHVASPDGELLCVRARFVVGADGGRSSVRGWSGIPMEGDTHPRKWVVIDCENDCVDAPYTALHCEPDRPYVCIHLPHGYRRWEFMLFPGEDAESFLADDVVRTLLARRVANPDDIRVVRARVYTHHSRVAAQFRCGNTFLVGDAAHLMPPWAGQGLNTGIRDVVNLSWKLAGVLRGQLAAPVLDTYEAERKQHAAAMVAMSTTLGRILSPTHHCVAVARDLFLRASGWLPPVKRWALEMKFKPMPCYDEGLAVTGTLPLARVGTMFPQPDVRTSTGSVTKLDDALGDWITILGWQRDAAEDLPSELLAQLRATGITIVKAVGACPAPHQLVGDTATVVVEDLDNRLRQWFEDTASDYVVLRPDRYIAAAAKYGELRLRTAEFLSLATPLTSSAPRERTP